MNLEARMIVVVWTVIALFALWMDRPAPVKSVQVDYCFITYPAAGQDDNGNWHFGWARGYGPCSLLDRYENA